MSRITGLLADKRPLIMGILNVTPDSFYDGGRYNSLSAAKEHALQLLQQGADIIDVGGESTRPGANPVPEQEELDRVIPVIEAIRAETDACISVDTSTASVMEQAAKADCDVVNDVTGADPRRGNNRCRCQRTSRLPHAHAGTTADDAGTTLLISTWSKTSNHSLSIE